VLLHEAADVEVVGEAHIDTNDANAPALHTPVCKSLAPTQPHSPGR
jgi:hypothetical protein